MFNSCWSKDSIKEIIDKPKTGGKCLQNISLTKYWHHGL